MFMMRCNGQYDFERRTPSGGDARFGTPRSTLMAGKSRIMVGIPRQAVAPENIRATSALRHRPQLNVSDTPTRDTLNGHTNAKFVEQF